MTETIDEIIIQAGVFAYAKAKPTGIKELSDGNEYLKKLASGYELYLARAPIWGGYDSITMDEAARLISGILPSTDDKGSIFEELYWTDKWTTPTAPVYLIFKIFTNNIICFRHVREILARSSIGDRAHPREWAEYASAKGLLPHTSMININNSPLLSLLDPGNSPMLPTQNGDELALQSKSGLTYSTRWMQVLNATVTQFFNPRRNPDAKKEEVVEWIMLTGANIGLKVSRQIAETIFTMIKPENHDPRKPRG